MEAQPRKIQLYKTADGKIPFDEWYGSLRSEKTKALIDKAIDKISLGLLTDENSEPVGVRVYEFKIKSGPGYRIYFGQKGLTVVLLHGGVKKTQERDIRKAKAYWVDYEERESANQ